MATLQLIASAVGTGLSVIGQIQQGQAAAAQAKYQAAVARNNQIIANQRAEDELKRGQVAVQQQRTRTQQLLGSQRAAQASQGLLVDTGSNLDTIVDTAGLGEFDALTIQADADRSAHSLRVQGANFGTDASLAKLRGKSAQQSAIFGAGTTLLTGAASVADKWYKFDKEGAFGT